MHPNFLFFTTIQIISLFPPIPKAETTKYCNLTDTVILKKAKEYLESEDMAVILLRNKNPNFIINVFQPLEWFNPQTIYDNLEVMTNICDKDESKWFIYYCENRNQVRKAVKDYWLFSSTAGDDMITRMDDVYNLRWLENLEESRELMGGYGPRNKLAHICDRVTGGKMQIDEPLDLIKLDSILGNFVTKDWLLLTKTKLQFSDELLERIEHFDIAKEKERNATEEFKAFKERTEVFMTNITERLSALEGKNRNNTPETIQIHRVLKDNSTVTTAGHICTDKCDKRGYAYFWCHIDTVHSSWDYCSPADDVDYELNACTDECKKKYGQPYFSCTIVSKGNGYCSPPPRNLLHHSNTSTYVVNKFYTEANKIRN